MFLKSEDELAKKFFADWLLVKSYLSFNKGTEIEGGLKDSVLISFVGLGSFGGEAGNLLQGAVEKGLKLRLKDVSLIDLNHDLEITLKKALPKVVIALGEDAKNFFVTNGASILNQGKWLSWQGVKVMPTFHPEYIITNPELKKEFWADLKLVIEELNL